MFCATSRRDLPQCLRGCAIHYELQWNGSNQRQALGRMLRFGVKNPEMPRYEYTLMDPIRDRGIKNLQQVKFCTTNLALTLEKDATSLQSGMVRDEYCKREARATESTRVEQVQSKVVRALINNADLNSEEINFLRGIAELEN